MGVMDLLRKRSANLDGNRGNQVDIDLVTATAHVIRAGNHGNQSNRENITNTELIENKVYCYRTTERPSAILTMITPNSDLSEAKADLLLKYGDRLIDVYPVSKTKH
jgi:hypothetical protein